MKRPLAYITAAWCGSDAENAKQAAQYCRSVYEAGFSPICPTLFHPLFLNDAIPEEHKSGIDMARNLLKRSHVLVVCGHTVTEAMKNDIAVAQRLRDENHHVYDVVAGTFLVAGLGAEDFCSLNEKQIEKYSEHFKTPELFLRINGRMLVIPVEEKSSRDKQADIDCHKKVEPKKAHKSEER